jgi:predicted nucleic acid-binding protein
VNPPTRAFVDASFYISLLWPGDAHHGRAMAWQASLLRARTRLLTTEPVLCEVLNGMARPPGRRRAGQLYRAVLGDPSVTVVRPDNAMMEAAVALYTDRPDKEWGLTDCLSFVVMARDGLRDALTSDHHFEQAGFAALLRNDPS